MASLTRILSLRPVWWLLIALLPYAAVSIVRWTEPPAATDGDYAHYLLHAQALAEGRPYTDIGYIYTARSLVGPRAQPPGWPIVLAPFVAVFGTHSAVFKFLVALLVGALGVISGYYFVRRREFVQGIAVAAVAPLALTTDWATGSALSDPLFCVLVWLVILIADREGPIGWRRGVMLALLTAAAISVRVVGVALVPAVLWYGLRRDPKERARVIVPMMALMVIGAAFMLQHLEWVPFLDRPLSFFSSSTLRTTARAYRGALLSGTLYPLASNGANDAYHVLVVIPLLIGAWHFLRTMLRTCLGSFVLFYGTLLVLSPLAESRYAWPLVPLMTAWICAGVLWLIGRLPSGSRATVVRATAAVAVVLVTSAAMRLALRPTRYSLTGDPDTEALFQWVSATSDTAQMRVVFTNPRVLTLDTGVPAMGIPFGSPEEIIAEFQQKRITHVVVPLRHATIRVERALARIVADRPSQFAPAFANGTHDVRRFIAGPDLNTDGPPPVSRSP
jgi:hypothetical protein